MALCQDMLTKRRKAQFRAKQLAIRINDFLYADYP